LNKYNALVTLLAMMLLTSCGPTMPQTELSTLTVIPTEISTQAVTPPPTLMPAFIYAPAPVSVDPSAILIQQNFDAGLADGLSINSAYWYFNSEGNGNQSFSQNPVTIIPESISGIMIGRTMQLRCV
jgi:hypothetical protein